MSTTLETIVTTLHELQQGNPQSADALTILALISLEESKGVRPLFRAIEDGSVEVKELEGSASVPEVIMIKKNPTRTFLLEGEMLSGGMQNRVVNASMIVEGMDETRVPVTCVERGRWSYHTAGKTTFQGDDTTSIGSVRSELSRSLWHNVRTASSFRSNQGAVWDTVTAALDATGVSSRTTDIGAMFDSRAEDIKALEQQFSLAENQIGHLAYLGGRTLVLELFGSSLVYQEYWDRLIKALLADSLLYTRIRTKHSPIARRSLEEVIDEISHADLSEGSSPGIGTDVRLKGQNTHGSALIVDGFIEHLVVHWDV